MSALSARGLTRELPGEVPVTLVRDIELDIGQGEFVVIMGPSGSGKSSLLYLLGLLDRPSAGTLQVDGVDAVALNEDDLADLRLRRLGFVFQFHFLLAEFSALDNVMLPMKKLGKLSEEAARTRALELLASFGLKDHAHKRPGQMSGGQRQRVAVARALANDPVIILADEPTGALDSASSTNLRDILRDLAHTQNRTVVAVTHDPSFASAADRMIYLVDGRIKDQGK